MLDELLTGEATPGHGRETVVPLFRPPVQTFDPDAPEVVQEVDAARLRAVQEVQELNSRELGSLAERYAASLQRLEQAVASIERVVASEVVDLALLVASELVQTEMRQNADLVLGVVESALSEVPHDGKVLVRMHPEDLASVKIRVDADTTTSLDWQEDPGLARGDCIVETPRRIIDASIGARLETVRDSLVRALMAEEKRALHETTQEPS